MGQHIRLLIADDDPRVRQGLRAVFSLLQLAQGGQHETHRADVEVVAEASNGQEAVTLAEQWQPDVVLMDVRMPVMDGLQATSVIKKCWPGVRVVLLTMHAAYRSEAQAAGADAFLIKGGSPQTLVEAIVS